MFSSIAKYANSKRNTKKSKFATILNAQYCKIVWNWSKALVLHRFHRSQSKKVSVKKNLEIVATFRNFAKWPQTSQNAVIQKLPKLKIFESCKIVTKTAKCINLSRNMKKIHAWQICKF